MSSAYEPNSFREDYIYFNRGDAKQKTGDFKGAIADFDKAIQSAPKHEELHDIHLSKVYYARANAKYEIRDFKGAIADYTSAIEIGNGTVHFDKEYYDKYYEAHAWRGFTKRLTKDYLGAIEDMDCALHHLRNNIGLYSARATLKIILKDFSGAQKDYEMLKKLDPGYIEGYLGCGYAKKEWGKNEEALEDLNTAIKLGNGIAHTYRGYIKKDMGDHEGAINDYEMAIKLVPENMEAHQYRADYRYELKNYKGAIEDYNNAIELYPHNESYFFTLGEFVVNIIGFALNKQPENISKLYSKRGHVKYLLGDNKGAIEDYDMSIKLSSEDDETGL
jgi:tetratricopeptide (TPR) repeat protein